MRTSSPDSDYNDYLSNLKKKTAGNASDFHIEGLSDLSELSDNKDVKPIIPSKFLKKSSTNDIKITGKESSKPLKDSKKINTPNTKRKGKEVNKSSYINKNLNDQMRHKQDVRLNLSDSDSNISFGSLSITPTPINVSSSVPKLRVDPKPIKKSHISDDDDSFGKDGRKFFKAKMMPSKETVVKKDFDDQITPRDISSPRKSTLRSAQTAPSNKKVTIADSITPRSINAQSSPDRSIISSTECESDKDKNFCGQKIMSFDYFEDEVEEKLSDSSHSNDDNTSYVGENIMSIADLVNDDILTESSLKPLSERVIDDNSMTEIFTEPTKHSSVPKEHSLSEILTVPATGRSTVRSNTSKLYSVDFEESTSKSKRSSIVLTKKTSMSYSSDFTKDESSTKSESIPKTSHRKYKKDKPEKHLKYAWDRKSSGEPYVPPGLGMGYVDPTPIAHYVVSPEALESVTAYSPCMILLTNMLRQQLQMTTNFIETQRRLYDSMMASIKPSYNYCTLEETKEFIRMNRGRKHSMKESMRLVEEDSHS